MGPKIVLLGFVFEVIFWNSLGPILDNFWNHFGDRFGHRIGPRRAKRRPGGPSRAPSSEKVEGSKQANGGHFVAFWTSKTGLESPRSHPRGILRAPKTLKMQTQKWNRFSSFLRPILEPFREPCGLPKSAKKWSKNGTKNGTEKH